MWFITLVQGQGTLSNSKWLAGRMRIKVRSRRPHGNKNLNYVHKNQWIWKNKQIDWMFPSKSSFFLCSRAALDPLAGRVFETPALVLLGRKVLAQIRLRGGSEPRLEVNKLKAWARSSLILKSSIELFSGSNSKFYYIKV